MTKKKEKGQLIVLSGPSGVGKSTLIAELLGQRKGIYFSVSYTTRRPRVGEADGINYNFVSRTEFERMIADQELLEYAEYVNNYYGTSLKMIQEKLNATFCWTSRCRGRQRFGPDALKPSLSLSSRPPLRNSPAVSTTGTRTTRT